MQIYSYCGLQGLDWRKLKQTVYSEILALHTECGGVGHAGVYSRYDYGEWGLGLSRLSVNSLFQELKLQVTQLSAAFDQIGSN